MLSSFTQSLIVGGLVGGAAAYLGSLMIGRKMALVGDALGHVALPGMGIAMIHHVDPSLGAFVFLMIGILIIWYLGESTLLSAETLVGIVFVTSLAFGFTVVPEPELLESLIGDISKISTTGTLISVVISGLVFLLVYRIYSGMVLLNISRDLAELEGIKTRRYNLIFLFAIALIVALGVKVTGSLLVGALVIIPPATARILTHNLRSYVWASIALGAGASILGIIFAEHLAVPSGPSIILIGAALFMLAFLSKFTRKTKTTEAKEPKSLQQP